MVDSALLLDDSSYSAISAVINITELLESILHYVAIPTMFRARTVSKRWHEIIDVLVRLNPTIRKRLFLEPATLEEYVELHKLDAGESVAPEFVRQTDTYPGTATPITAVINPYFFRIEAGEARLRGTPTYHASRNPLYGNMFLTQPPFAQHRWVIKCGKASPNITPTIRQKFRGEVILAGSKIERKLCRRFSVVMSELEDCVEQRYGSEVRWAASTVLVWGHVTPFTEVMDELAGEVVLDERMWELLETSA